MFIFILNPSFIDTAFQVKHLMIKHVLERNLYIYTERTIAGVKYYLLVDLELKDITLLYYKE